MKRKLITLFLLISLVIIVMPTQAAATDLFFSEYIEGSSNNKALEIYNGTGAAVDLAAGGYSVQMYFNGNTAAGLTINLAGVVADGDVFVLAHSSADPAILAQADQTNGAGWFNGNDAVVLRKAGAVIDAVGQVGNDPGAEWSGGGIGTQDETLRRKAEVCAGDANETDPFDPSITWDGFAQNTFDGLGAHAANCNGETDEPKINEFSASTTGDDFEYVEIFGAPDTDFSAYTVLEIEGDGGGAGVVDEVIGVGTTDAGGFWLQSLPNGALENGTITLLLVNNFTGALGTDLDTNNDGVFDVTPWDAIVDAVAVNDGGAGDLTYGDPALGPNYDGLSSFAPGGASRIPDGLDTDAASDWARNDFELAGIPGFPGTPVVGEALNTPGAMNELFTPPPEVCGDPVTHQIYEIQGNGLASPLVGMEVAFEGIVVGDFQEGDGDHTDLDGVHVQVPDAETDADPATSDGIFVFAPGGMDVSLGDEVRVRGTVAEFNGLTEISGVSVLLQCSTGNALPTAAVVTLPVGSLDEFEPFEGMLVTIPQEMYISEFFNFDRFGEIVLTTERQYQPTAIHPPGSPEAALLAQDNLLGRITLDDGRSSQNPDPAIHPNGGVFDLSNLFRGGDIVENTTGVMDFAFGLYRIQPTQGADFTVDNPRPAQHEAVGGNLEVASFNVLNYFTTFDTGAFICGPTGGQECRGADDANEFTRQRDKIIAALAEINADVVGLIEIENAPTDAPVADLVSGLNDELGAGAYDYVATGPFGTDAIKQAFIYKPDSVSLVGDYAVLDSAEFLDPTNSGEDRNRPALAQTFIDNETGGIFTVVVNHLKSKGSECGPGDDDPVQGNCNLTRTLSAQVLADWLATDPTGSGDPDFLIIGDLNSYDKEDPIGVFSANGFTDLLLQYQGEQAYSYLFDGQLGYLDYAMGNAEMLDEITGATVWHINADEADLIDYDTTFKGPNQDAIYAPDAYRSSDHDPVITGLEVCDAIPPTLEVSVSPDVLWPPNHKYVTVMATVTPDDNFDPNPVVSLVSVTSDEPDNGIGDGNTINDIVIVNDFTFKLRAERSGSGDGRVYTITYQVSDTCGNTTLASDTVSVPLNNP